MHEHEIEITKENFDSLKSEAVRLGKPYIKAFEEQINRQGFFDKIMPLQNPTPDDIDWAKKLQK